MIEQHVIPGDSVTWVRQVYADRGVDSADVGLIRYITTSVYDLPIGGRYDFAAPRIKVIVSRSTVPCYFP